MRRFALVLAVLAAVPTLVGQPLCCIVPGSACCTVAVDEPACPCCASDHGAPADEPIAPVRCDCPLAHMHWAPVADHDDAPPAPLVADADPVVFAAPRPASGLPAPEGPAPPRGRAALSLPLLL